MSNCLHCDQETLTSLYDDQNGPFCCRGCLTVYNVLKNKGLSEYYEIKKNVKSFKARAPASPSSNQYSYLDNEDFKKDYSYRNYNNELTIEFYLEGIHCLACLWVIEKLNIIIPGVTSSKLNIGRSVATISISPEGNFKTVAQELDQIGYHPHPLKINQSENEHKVKEERSALLRIGIAGAAAGNIMLYAISLYAGAGAEYEYLFNAITVAFALPVLTYCAYPFYKNSFTAIKNKNLSIDVPISMALIVGAIMGIYNLMTGVPENYFDSLTALVFLLLLSRYFLKIIQEKGLSTNDLNFFYQGESLLKATSSECNEFTEIHPKQIRLNDIIKINPQQIIPTDGTIIKGSTYINSALLTGESELQKVNLGQDIFSGTQNMGQEILIKVTNLPKESRLGKILQHIENGWSHKSQITALTNTVSKYFVAVVFLLSGLLFYIVYKNHDLKMALEQSLTLLIVTCPCALAIATPLSFIRSLTQSAKKGIIIKDDAVIEKMAKTQTIFLDKTGTITESKVEVVEFTIIKNPTLSFSSIIHNLENHSHHPVALSLKSHFSNEPFESYEVLDLQEQPGQGVAGIIHGQHFKIYNYSLFENNEIIATFKVDEKIKKDAKAALLRLQQLGIKIKILSGDKPEKVESISREIALENVEYLSALSPEMKWEEVKNNPQSIMVGDGANDAIALSSADTGIAVYGAMDISLRAADIYLTTPGLHQIVDLIIMSKETMKVIYRNLILSLFYNSISVILAFTGYISPMTAAIIMPLSSLSVLISSFIGTKELRSQWK